MKLDQEIKTILFARWLAGCYADSHIDNKGKSQHEEGFNSENFLSVLNQKNSYWYKEQLDYFNKEVYPNYIENGTVKNHKEFLS